MPQGVVNVDHQRAGGCRRGRRGADRASGGAADQLHRSTRVGRIIAEIAAAHLKPVLLELGGKAPLVVLDDADIDGAVNAAVFGAFMNQGQICMSTERIIVDEKVADDFVAKLAAKARIAAGRRSAPAMSCSARWSAWRRPSRSDGADQRCGRRRARSWSPADECDGTVMSGDRARPRDVGHAHLWRGIVRAGRLRDPRRRAWTRRSASPTTRNTGSPPPSSARDISAGASRSRTRIDSGICHINGPTVARRGADAVRRREGAAATAASAARRRSPNSPICAGSPSRPARSIIRSEGMRRCAFPSKRRGCRRRRPSSDLGNTRDRAPASPLPGGERSSAARVRGHRLLRINL